MKRLAEFCVDHRKTVFFSWVVVLVIAGIAAGGAGAKFSENFQLPDSDSTQAINVLKDRFPAQSGDSAQIVYQAKTGTIADFQQQIEQSLAKICTPSQTAKSGCDPGIPYVSGVVSPFEVKQQVAKGGKIAFASVSFSKFSNDIPTGDLNEVITQANKAAGNGLVVAEGGQPIETATNNSGGGSSELISLIGAMVILLLVFGSFVAMGLPILTAVISLGTAISLITLATHIFSVADFAVPLASLIGLGVGIDYALFLMTRYRAGLGEGLEPRQAVIRAVDTAGRAVMFAGITVMIAVLGMVLLGVSFLYGPAVAASLAVLLTMTAALTLLPAMLGKVGDRVDRLRLPGMKPKPRVESPGGRWMRWSRFVERHPLATGGAALVVLVVLTIPVFSLDLGSADAGTDPTGSTTRQAYDLLAEGFGPGFNGPLEVVVELPSGARPITLAAELKRLGAKLGRDPDVAEVGQASLSPDKTAAVLNVIPKTSPQAQETEQLVKRIRSDVAPPFEQSSGTTIHVGGTTAIFADFATVLTEKLPLFIGVVVLLSAILLTAVFRSVFVPLKAVVMNLLSIGASLGIVVAIFQKGWAAGLFGVDAKAPIEPFLPVMVFAIIFGLSMDYEVFLMSRIHEEWEKRRDAPEAVARGLAATGRVITAAASIMVFVFASFALGDDRIIKLFGIGLASAVLIDAVIIRTILVPSIMVLLNRRAWWIPGWLDRLLPKLNVEPPETHEAEPAKT